MNTYTDTLDWDTVYAIPISKVNEAIKNQGSSPENFRYEKVNTNGTATEQCEGTFGAWNIVSGGDGSEIRFSIPITNFTGHEELVGDFSWNSFSLIVGVQLQFLPHILDERQNDNGKTSKIDLKIKTTPSDSDEKAVSMIRTISNSDPTFDRDGIENVQDIKTLIGDLITNWLNENLSQFNYVFATVDLNNYIEKDEQWAWIKATDVDYAYADTGNNDGILGILCMTNGRKADEGQERQLDPYAIPEGSIAGFLVAEKRLLNDLILPRLSNIWKNSSINDYEIVNNDDTETGQYEYVLKLKDNKSIKLDDVEHLGVAYTPYIKTMTITLDENEVIFSTRTETDVHLGITAWCTTTHWYTITLGTNKDGKQTLFYNQSKAPDVQHGITHDATAPIISAVSTIIGILIEGLAIDIGNVMLGILGGLVTGGMGASAWIDEALNTDTSPSIDLMVSNTIDPITWNGGGVFDLNYAGLHGPLQLGGTPFSNTETNPGGNPGTVTPEDNSGPVTPGGSEPEPESTPEIDLFGWDTVYGISYTQVNEAIKTLKATPTSFQYQKEGSAFEDASSIAGEWGDWQIITSGDGKNVTFKCPITSGTLTYNNTPHTFSNENWIDIEFELTYINQNIMDYIDETAKEGTGQQQNLVPNTTKQNASDSIVSIRNSQLSFTGLNDADNEVVADICKTLFGYWFNDNLDKFKFIFSKLIVNQTADKGAFQWLKPTSIAYAVESADEDLDPNPDSDPEKEKEKLLAKSVLGVMAMTEGRTNGTISHEIDARLLNVTNRNSAFAFSSTLFVEKWLLPGLLTLIPGTTKDNYELNDDGLSYTNKNAIEWTTFQDEDGNNKTATIDVNGLKLGIENNIIRFEMINLQWEVKDGITVHVNYIDYYKVSLKSGVDKQGNSYKNVLIAEPTEKPKLTMSYTTSDALRIKEILTGVFVVLAGAILGGLSGGTLDGLDSATSTIIDDSTEVVGDNVTVDIGEAVSNLAQENGEELTSVWDPDVIDADLEEDINISDQFQQQGEEPDMSTDGAIKSKIASKVSNFAKFVKMNKWKIIGSTIGSAVGAVVGSAYHIADTLAQEKFSQLPTLDEFTSNCVGSVKWTNNSGFDLNSATLFTGGFLLGGNLIPEAETNPGGNPGTRPENFQADDSEPPIQWINISGSWNDWQILSSDGENIVVKCPIKSGYFNYMEKNYRFKDGDFINIKLKLDDFNSNNSIFTTVTINKYKFSFDQQVIGGQFVINRCLALFISWINSKSEQVRQVLQLLLGSQ